LKLSPRSEERQFSSMNVGGSRRVQMRAISPRTRKAEKGLGA
jgi:hypothetical protein